MMRIAVCDDEISACERVVAALRAWEKTHGIQISSQIFHTALSLIDAVEEHGYTPDLIFLDIHMPGINGMDAAKGLRGQGYHGHIVFLTGSREHALEAWSIGATQYLVKPASVEMIGSILDKIYADAEEEPANFITLKSNWNYYRFSVRNFIFAEALGHRLEIHLKSYASFGASDRPMSVYMSVKKFESLVAAYPQLIRVGAAYIINMAEIMKLNAKEVCFLNYTGTNGSARAFADEMESSGVAAAIRAEAGNERYEYFYPKNNPETVLLIDAWRDQAALDAHHASPMMGQIMALREKYDLHMKAERYVSAEENAADAKFIKK